MATSSADGVQGSKQLAPEITAEWTVHAQLTLSHPGNSKLGAASKDDSRPTVGESVNDENAGDSVPAAATSNGCNQNPPLKVVYKFSTNADSPHGIVTTGSNNLPAATAGLPTGDASGTMIFKQGGTIFNATDSASGQQLRVMSPNRYANTLEPNVTAVQPGAKPQAISVTSQLFPKCSSTCSIVLTADLLPVPTSGEPINVNVNKCASTNTVPKTADKYTCFPEKPYNDPITANVKDVSCQTSDIESATRRAAQNAAEDLRSQQKKAAEALLSPILSRRDDQYGPLARKSPTSPTNIVSPSNTLQSQRSSLKDSKKKPRTVHIDVYCTGSDAESSSTDESSIRSVSSSSSGSRFDTSHLEPIDTRTPSNATHPTIFESEEMKVHHKRAAKHDIPRRRLLQQTVDQSTLSTTGSLKKTNSHTRKPVKRSNTKEEIHESKQMLLNKILGDQKDGESFPSLEYLQHVTSDDNLSSNYPFSVRSPKRDITGSSLSSALADFEEATTSANPTPSAKVVIHSDSFEYENSEDRYRINQMERLWGKQTWKSPSVERKLLEIHNPKRRANSESDNNLSESDHSFIFDNNPPKPNESVHSLNSDSSPSTVKSNRTPSNVDSSPKRFLQQALLTVSNSATFPPRSWSPIEGYTSEYLALARRFGSLITGRRKPGVHIGPVRNPECPCEHCRRWILERDGGPHERAHSVEIPANIVDMRKQFHLRNRHE
ncbi:uncharacterized protein LOC129725558 isoform X2 [Wyeomyia smithii]|uniref:uncharacterized protein LOC129725558 isoform X2 n=1 Tax=Wyeomyia smithii TaxID=174621 RepID=UPI00246807D1|nr:uncharacterized protein LOC129725558 isoform X2 [Wyeomyia smithii]